MKKLCITGVCILLLIFAVTSSQAQQQGSRGEPEWMSQITDSQKNELSALIKEITITMLSEWGIEFSEDELPDPFDHPGPPQGGNNGGPGGGKMDSSGGNMGGQGGDSRPQEPEWMDELSEAQRKELMDEISSSVQDKLEGWGIDVSSDEIHFGPPPQGGR